MIDDGVAESSSVIIAMDLQIKTLRERKTVSTEDERLAVDKVVANQQFRCSKQLLEKKQKAMQVLQAQKE